MTSGRTRSGADVPASETTTTAHAETMQGLYRRQARIFDLTRGPVLLGRRHLARHVPTGSRVLEVGCGTGHNLESLRRSAGSGGSVTGVECAPAMADRADARGLDCEVRRMDYGSTCYGPERFDVVVFSYVLSMMPHYREALACAHRDLVPGGRVITLDFARAWARPVRAAMIAMGVSLGEDRTTALRDMFRITLESEHRAWGGLWQFRLIVAVREDGEAVAGARSDTYDVHSSARRTGDPLPTALGNSEPLAFLTPRRSPPHSNAPHNTGPLRGTPPDL